ncbi:MAG: NAD-dependent epimerase/dehydratase family protein [Phycisphaerae bacterium]|nr:NAD-dependent epimerase/dehydratase family protein [Phycisphaerae bacterium]
MNTRREFIVQVGTTAMGAALIPASMARALAQGAAPVAGGAKPDAKPGAGAAPSGKRSLLILGGTGFLGPQVVRHARDRGYEVTLFNRGKTAPDLFPEVEHIEGDRYSDLDGLKKAVADGRKWDCVVDTFTYVPKTVTDAMDILLPAMGQFIVVSTISVYASNDEPNANEDAKLAEVADDIAAGIDTHEKVGQHYGAMKARVEKAAMERFPGKVTIIRPGLIVGPRDTTGRYSYWPVRGSEGGRMIAPGTGDDFIQIVDVRDLGEFTVHCAEVPHFGVFNAVNPAGTRTIRDVVDAAVRSGGDKAQPVWISEEFLKQNGVSAWQHMPAWVPKSADGYAGIGQTNTDRAVKAGLKTRDLADVNAAILEYYRVRGAEIEAEKGAEFAAQWRRRIRGGLAPEKEKEVLTAWDSRDG